MLSKCTMLISKFLYFICKKNSDIHTSDKNGKIYVKNCQSISLFCTHLHI